jgi:L-ribulose-5-phosphate 3-epimerase
MQVDGHDLAICSWSLRNEAMGDLVRSVKELGLNHLQLAIGPLLFLDDKRKFQELGHLRNSGIQLTGTMIAFPAEDYSTIARIRSTGGFMPDETWPLRKQITLQAARLSQELGAKILTTHAGFIPPSNHVDYAKIVARVSELAKALEPTGVTLTLETGQEEADELLQFLNDLPGKNVAVNFDPANMILYGSGDPIEAIYTLGRHIRHVHVKDAIESEKPGLDWGKQVSIGDGQVHLTKFLEVLKEIGYTGPLAIERETGSQTVEDLHAAITKLHAAL